MCSNQRLRELLLPLLLLPTVVPVLVPCIEATAVVLRQDPLDQLGPLLRLMAAYDAVFIALALALTIGLTLGLLANDYQSDPVLLIACFFAGLCALMFGWYFKAMRLRWGAVALLGTALGGLMVKAV